MMIRRGTWTIRRLVIGGVVCALAACGPGRESPPPEIVVGVIVADDGGAWGDAVPTDGFGAGRDVRIVREEADGAAAVGDAVRRQIAAGTSVILCLGEACGSAIMAEAPRHRETRFVAVPTVRSSENLDGVELNGAGAGYLAGVAASVASEPRAPIGLLVGSPNPWFDEVVRGFEAGVAASRSGPHPLLRTRDIADLHEAGVAVALVSPSAEFSPIEVVATPYAILADGDPADLGRAGVVGVVRVDRREALRRVLTDAISDVVTGGQRVFGLESGLVDLELDPAAPVFANETFPRRMEEAREAVLSGIVAVESFGL
jgi:basic membrane lipoprotein Med (substrate-binding protein (PBP1-ABC) superfamily)